MPPLHPNCQCSVVALDNASSLVYDLNRQSFMSAVEVILRNSDGGIWSITNSDINSNMRVGFVPFELRPIAVSEEPTITDDTGQFPIIDSVINQDTLDNPRRVVKTRDTRWLPGTDGPLNEPATAYFASDGSYVVRNDLSGEIVQISNKFDPDWVCPWDAQ